MARWRCTRPDNCIERCSMIWPTKPKHCFYDKEQKNIPWKKVKEEKKEAIVIK